MWEALDQGMCATIRKVLETKGIRNYFFYWFLSFLHTPNKFPRKIWVLEKSFWKIVIHLLSVPKKKNSLISTFQNDDDDGDDSDDARKMKNKKQKKKPQVEVVQYQKPDVYELSDESDSGQGIGHHHGSGLHKIKKHGRSIGGLFIGRCIGKFRYPIIYSIRLAFGSFRFDRNINRLYEADSLYTHTK